MANTTFDENSERLDHWLKIFYRKLFPCELICKWLSYSTKDIAETLSRREFSFSLAGDVYVRYQSFNDASSLRKELVKSCPHKIDIGAVYSAPPKLQRSLSSASFTPEWKELVFDIDLTDYDEIRFCCGSNNPGSETAVCHRCWQLAKCAVVCMDRALREDFGFEQILWVFSGRRGVHCWVCDPAARRLDSVGRTAVAEYLSIVHGAESRKQTQKSLQNDSRLIEPMLHPLLESSAELLKSRFADYCVSQDLLSSRHPSGVRFVLKHLPADMAAQSNSLDQQWTTGNESGESTAKRWNTLKRFLKDEHRNNVIKDIILKVTYPRLDINVTTGTGHLLKSPFCVHPKTGFVCVPIDPQRIDEFDPTKVPRLGELMEQLSQASASAEGEASEAAASAQHLLPYKQTTLRPYIEFFDNFVSQVCAPRSSDARPANTKDGVRAHSTQAIPA